MRRARFLLPGLLLSPVCWALPPHAGEVLGWAVAGFVVLMIWWFVSLIDFKLLRLAARVGSAGLLVFLVHRPWWQAGLLVALLVAMLLEEWREERDGEDVASGFGVVSLLDD